eukprot:CAMPEP_0197027238 /NCGR_PEP_ID=MMETSP1384-20130603/7189_1 /TAXON_ID=29189 /ORGANISM="Ammonia sp." /LENGTH=218 /DNA_ID=CAMNT_0042456051 /DNA_START=24 /DNA_END=680 /DNA_ORIENTATION=+
MAQAASTSEKPKKPTGKVKGKDETGKEQEYTYDQWYKQVTKIGSKQKKDIKGGSCPLAMKALLGNWPDFNNYLIATNPLLQKKIPKPPPPETKQIVCQNIHKLGFAADGEYYDMLQSQSQQSMIAGDYQNAYLPATAYQSGASSYVYSAQPALAYQSGAASTDYAMVMALSLGMFMMICVLCFVVNAVIAAGCFVFGQSQSSKPRQDIKYRVVDHEEV